MAKPFRFSATITTPDPTQLADRARRAEELGFSTVTLSDHFWDQPAPLIGLTAAALATSSVRLLPLVLANDYRHPAVLAKEIATLDVLSEGRVDLGIGAGWAVDDYEHSGIAYDSPGTRIARLAESVEILRGLLDGDTLDFHGDHYDVVGPLTAPRPVQKRVPLVLAGGKQKMLTLAGERADIVGINPGLTAGVMDERAGRDATAEQTDQKITWVRDGAGERFDELELQTRVHLSMISDDRDAVAAEMAPLFGISADEALASPHALIGTVDECIDIIRSWRDRWGISFIGLDGDAMDDFAPVVEALAGT